MLNDGDQIPPPAKNMLCPMTMHRESGPIKCREMYEDCPKYTVISFTNPQTGTNTPYAGCSEGVLPLLLVDVSNRMNQLGIASDQTRDEIHKFSNAFVNIAALRLRPPGTGNGKDVSLSGD